MCIEVCFRVCIGVVKHVPFHDFLAQLMERPILRAAIPGGSEVELREHGNVIVQSRGASEPLYSHPGTFSRSAQP